MKKNIFTALIAMMLILCMAMPAMAEAAIEIALPDAEATAEAAVEPTATPEPQPVEVPAVVILPYKDGSINVRAEATTDSAIVTSLKHEDDITVILYGDIWSRIMTKSGKEGYIKNLYINDGNTAYAAGNEYFSAAKDAATAAETNLLAGAFAEAAVITSLTADTKLTALAENGAYTLVSLADGALGYVETAALK